MENYYFKHSSHFGDMFGLFEEFYRSKTLADVMIACDGKTIHAHRIVLSAGSDYFRRVLANIKNSNQFPVLFISDIAYEDMETIIEFIYRGQIVVTRDKVESLRQAAYKLRIKGFENFLRKPFFSNGMSSMSNGFKMSNGTMRNISILNDNKRIIQMNEAMESKKLKVGHDGNRLNGKDLLIFNRYKEEMKRLSSSHLENALQRGMHSTPNGNMSKKINIDQIMKRNSVDSNLKPDSPRNDLIDLKMNKKDSDSVTITAINGESQNNGNCVDSCDENEDNHKNENAENVAVEKSNESNGNCKENGKSNEKLTKTEECDSDDAQEINYTYELDPNALTQWDSYNDENMPDANNESGEGYEDEEDYFEAVNRNSMEIMLNQANLAKFNGLNGSSGFYYCEHCPKYFFDEDHLQLHIKRTHGLNKLNQCNICGKTYAWKSGLYKHKRHVHNISGKSLTQVNDNVMDQPSVESAKA